MANEDISAHAFALATELLEDVELSRIPVEALVLKARRLSRLVDDDDMDAWLALELGGIPATDEGRQHMTATRRWVDFEKDQGFWQGIGEIEGLIESQTALLATLQLPDVSGDHIAIALRETRQQAAGVANVLGQLTGIRSRVLAHIHNFVSTRYYELSFSDRQAAMFEAARAQVDALLSPLSGETLAKVDSIYRRLAEGDAEAVSQALNTCRRLIDAVADAIYPPTDDTIVIDGNTVHLTKSHVQNRLNAYVRDNTESDSRRKKLRRTLGDLYDRVSTGVHNDVTGEEARFLSLNTYLFLGEVLALGEPSA